MGWQSVSLVGVSLTIAEIQPVCEGFAGIYRVIFVKFEAFLLDRIGGALINGEPVRRCECRVYSYRVKV